MKETILVELDGVLAGFDFEPEDEMPAPNKGAGAFLSLLSKKYDIVILTHRPLLKTADWVFKFGFEKYIYDITNKKIPAKMIISSNALCFAENYNMVISRIPP